VDNGAGYTQGITFGAKTCPGANAVYAAVAGAKAAGFVGLGRWHLYYSCTKRTVDEEGKKWLLFIFMAYTRKNNTRKKASSGWLIFWLFFFVGITLLFLVNVQNIKNTLAETRVLERLVQEGNLRPAGSVDVSGSTPPVAPAPGLPQADLTIAATPTPAAPAKPDAVKPADKPADKTPEKPADKASDKTVDRSVYLMKVDNAGAVYWTKVKRTLPASNKPLQDALESVIRGPSAEEEKQGLISLIPKSSKILSATIKGDTAYISFNEEFLFNTYGTEGYASQRRQIVLTATEFNNVKDVQILIDGKRIDYLGEGVWIGSPVSRTML
jgi:spore germination protein GerM